MQKPSKSYGHVLAIDPSGDFTKGKGTTGICYLCVHNSFVETFEIKATDFSEKLAYWNAVINVIAGYKAIYNKDLAVVVEDYILYAEKAENQVHSLLETPRIIGVIEWYCYINDIPCYLEFASMVKKRWTLAILAHKGYLTKSGRSYLLNGQVCSDHRIDALRHAVHYATFINKGAKSK